MSRKESGEPHVKRMADLLRQGSTLTELACPACASPLFRLRNGDLWCGRCEKKVIIMKEGEDLSKFQGAMALENLEVTLLAKIKEIQDKLQHEEDSDKLRKLGATLADMLENLERVRKAKRA